MSKFVIRDNDLGSFLTIRTQTAQVFESVGDGSLGTKVVGDMATTAIADGAVKPSRRWGWKGNDRHRREGDDHRENDEGSDDGAAHDDNEPPTGCCNGGWNNAPDCFIITRCNGGSIDDATHTTTLLRKPALA
ncbi:hypothetical protein [Variovorax gossypii]